MQTLFRKAPGSEGCILEHTGTLTASYVLPLGSMNLTTVPKRAFSQLAANLSHEVVCIIFLVQRKEVRVMLCL